MCEETIFRGYLQRQFIALTKNAAAGILLCAAAFGAAHAYQGVRMVILIAFFGAMFGILAHLGRERSPGNDRSCLAGFIERNPGRSVEALIRFGRVGQAVFASKAALPPWATNVAFGGRNRRRHLGKTPGSKVV